ncbi:two-component system response regulator NarL [Azoarcus sp. TTM-91]|uniref:two-component system response regulator NarL n=1 Tax=Azoarcus sp. TTM-91 TaxID=2691581 RepID=UPI00145D7DEE|nr:two-component system response regulator NarL [Azoarcus sp. TTM-91]NMG35746.1 two-component system response regulator NarL [Azoarcus sp. TTM-91]
MSEERQRVVLVDDHPLFRKGLAQLLATVPAFDLIGEAAGGSEGLALCLRLAPDLLLLDLNMKDMGGLEVLRGVRAAQLDTRVVMITVSDAGEDLVAALRAGADGYLLKDMEPEAMVEALAEAAAGRIVISEQLTHLMAAALRGETRPRSVEAAGLTEQELRILGHIANGLSNKLIGRELDIAEGTVKVHVKHILRKLAVRSRVEAAVWAVEHLRAPGQAQ